MIEDGIEYETVDTSAVISSKHLSSYANCGYAVVTNFSLLTS